MNLVRRRHKQNCQNIGDDSFPNLFHILNSDHLTIVALEMQLGPVNVYSYHFRACINIYIYI